MFEAACANCESWANSACSRNLAPPEGEPRCDRYQISDAFASLLASKVLAENPIRTLVPLRHLTAADRKRLRGTARPRRRGFRA